MSEPLPLPNSAGGNRFPGFDVTAQADQWDDVTRAVVMKRLGTPAPITFFTEQEESVARALFDQLLDQHNDPRVPVVNMVDQRLAEGQTDGWHYDDLPPDPEAWRATLAFLDDDARELHASGFAALDDAGQESILGEVQRAGSGQWHGMPAGQVWSLWTRYACTAFYSHPAAWQEIGFAGPAYPRGYKNIGLDRREPFEVADAHPSLDPLRKEQS